MRRAVKRTLVGRMAGVQLAVVVGALAAMLLLSFAAVTYVLTRSWDQGLLSLCEVGTKRADKRAGKQQGPRWVLQELEEHRPIGVRVEVQDRAGAVLGADGKGPPLAARGDGCRNQGAYRVCQAEASGLRILAGVSRAEGLADRDRFMAASAVIALALALAALASSRLIARRALSGLSAMARGIAKLQPGTGQRVAPAPAYAELDGLAQSFDGLLARVEEALAVERRFAAEASHELKTPLTVVRAEVEELARTEPAGGPAGRALAAVDGLIRLVESLLWLARSQGPLDPAALEVVNLADLAREETARVAAAYPPRPIEVDAPDEVLVAAEERLLARAVANLVDNACKHSPPGTPVRVAVGERGGQARLSVEDSGPGIPPELRARVFEPFFRGGQARARDSRAEPPNLLHPTPADGRGDPGSGAKLRGRRGTLSGFRIDDGFGLGLPLAHTVARALAGRLSLEPAGPGSRFVLEIPSVAPGA